MIILKEKNNRKITEEEYLKQETIIQTQIKTLREKQQMLTDRINKTSLDKYKPQKIFDELDKMTTLDHFDEDLFKALVDEITIRQRYNIEFKRN